MLVRGLRTARSLFSGAAVIRHCPGAAFAAALTLAVSALVPPPALARQGRDLEASDQACAPGIALGDVRIAVGGQYRLMGNGSNFGFHDRTIGGEQPGSLIGNQLFRRG
jgi:hypothetical protein